MKATIDTGTPVFTLINTFEVEPGCAAAVVASLRDFTEKTTRQLPGFVATAVHVSLDRSRVVNYVQWASAEDLQGMLSLPEAQEHQQEIRRHSKSVVPFFYSVEYVCVRGDGH